MADYRDRRRGVVPPPVARGSRLVSAPNAPSRRPVGDPYGGRRPAPGRRRKRRPWSTALIVGAVALSTGVIAAAVIVGLSGLGDDPGGGEPAAPVLEPTTTVAEGGEEVASTELTAPQTPLAPVPPYVEAGFDGKNLVLTGVVGDSGLVEQLEATSQLIYAPFTSNDVQVDPQLESPDWLAVSPQAIALLQTISSGSLVLSEGQLTVSGQAASPGDAAELETYLQATGLPVEIAAMEITNLREAVYVIAASEGSVALSGALPTEEIRTGLANAAAAIYGPDNVFDASTVDPTVASALWMFTPEALIATLSAFATFEVRLDGGDFSASLSGGSVFDSNSVAITPEFAQVLNFGIVVLSRDPSMTIGIEGHTDSEGAADYNLELSQERADAVAAYFIQAGIDPARVSAVGMGEQSPAAPNDTPEGRARNRRVEFSLQSGA